MNETLEKILKPVKQAASKAVVKVGLPLMLTLGAANYANAQIDPVDAGRDNFEVLSEVEREIHLRKKVNPYVDHVREDVTYTLDILKIKNNYSGATFTVLYLGDRNWNKGDKINADYITHNNVSDKTWTDREVSFYMNVVGASASRPNEEDFYDAILTKINSLERAEKDE